MPEKRKFIGSRVAAFTRAAPLRIGFIDLIDAAPLIVALELGLFAEEGLNVLLERQLGWGNIRDKLTFGQLDAAHALLGMPLFSQLHRDWFIEPLVAVMNLGSAGNAITLSNRLTSAGVRSAATLCEYIRNDPRGEVLSFGHVFSCSMHHYLLRDWLASGGIDPDHDVRLRVFPPNQMTGLIARGQLDGFCVGEPWNTLAARSGGGKIVAFTSDIIPNHPEKVLAVSRRWMQANFALLEPMIRAILRACEFCDDPQNAPALIALLAQPQYLSTSEEIVRESLTMDSSMSVRGGRDGKPIRGFAATFPSKTHPAWMAQQMRRWHHLPDSADIALLSSLCADAAAYRIAAGSMGIDCPRTDYPPMPMRAGDYQFQNPGRPARLPAALISGDPNELRKPKTLSA